MTTPRERVQDASWPAILAAYLAGECGLQPGNMWEPGIVRGIRRDLAQGKSKEEIRASLFMSVLGVFPEDIPKNAP